MPLRLHQKKDIIEEFFQNKKKIVIIPVYEGNQDFKYKGGEKLTTKLFMPLTEKGSLR